jgi:hypothetical protein
MRVAGAFAAAILGALVLAASASPAIVIGRGIAGVTLGMSQAAVRAGFGDVQCRTTAANAFSVATGSLYLQRRRPANSIAAQWVGLQWQLRARLAHASDPNSGEECVLRARKS